MLTIGRRWITALRFIVAALLVLLILKLVHWPDLAATLLGMRPGYAVAAVSAFAGVSLLEALRIKLIFPGEDLPFRFLLKVHVLSSAPANVSPAQLGGDAYRIFRLRTRGVDLLTATTRIALLRVFGMAVVVATTALTLPASPVLGKLFQASFFPTTTSLSVGWTAASLSLAAILFIGWWAAKRVRRNASTLSGLGNTAIAQLLVVSMVMLALRAVTLGLLGQTVGIDPGPLDTVLITCLATLATVLPISIAGIGVREGVIVALLTATGSDYDASVGVAILSRSLMLMLGLTGVAWWLTEPRRKVPSG